MTNGKRVWLISCAIMVLLMIFIGGLTRLSDAGLSIVEWKPISGIFPPSSEAEWNAEFMKYQSSPEFKLINNNISVDKFRAIFWLEFIHRFVARITGVMIFIPFLYFCCLGKISVKNDKKYIMLPLLFLMQGVMGWLMVKSGLIDNPHVSHFRLAIHLLFAVLLYHVIILCLQGRKSRGVFSSLVIAVIYLQIILGALVAGLDAGMIYNSFPLMGGMFVPVEVFSQDSIIGALSDPAFVQFLHRVVAYVLTILLIIRIILIWPVHKMGALVISVVLVVQFLLGVITLVYGVPIAFALLHQLVAMILLGCMIVIDINRKNTSELM